MLILEKNHQRNDYIFIQDRLNKVKKNIKQKIEKHRDLKISTKNQSYIRYKIHRNIIFIYNILINSLNKILIKL